MRAPSAKEARVVHAAKQLVMYWNKTQGTVASAPAFVAAWRRLREAVGDLEAIEQHRPVATVTPIHDDLGLAAWRRHVAESKARRDKD